MRVWRIGTETRLYKADDLSGAGAAASPGRWNAEKEPVIYCAPTVAMCVLETTAHIDGSGLPLNRFLVEIEIPDKMWLAREEMLDPSKLPAAWCAIPAGRASVDIGSAWLNSLRSPVLLVPSVIAREEPIVLINPKHPDASGLGGKVVRKFEYDTIWRAR